MYKIKYQKSANARITFYLCTRKDNRNAFVFVFVLPNGCDTAKE